MSLIIQAINSPFNLNFSSCGTRIPKTFIWSRDKQEIQVYIDTGLSSGLSTPNHKKKFGWFCESRGVKHNLYKHIVQNYNSYKNAFNKIFTCDRDLIRLDPTFFIFNYAGSNLPWTPDCEYGLHPKTKKISFLSSKSTMTEGHRYRLHWVEKLRTKVDIFGGASGSNQIGINDNEHYHHKKKTEALNDYFYSMTFENCKYDCYFTEKITDCFANGVIPIYHGTTKISEIFDPRGIIFFDESFDPYTLTEEYYYLNIDSVRSNMQTVINMENADDMLVNNIRKII